LFLFSFNPYIPQQIKPNTRMKTMFKIGHYTDSENLTGCTAILCPPGTVASCHIPGTSPGSRETPLLNPVRKIQFIHGLVLTGGSAFGLSVADGVMRYLSEQQIGYQTSAALIPIVPAAVIYDLNVGNASVRPGPDEGYAAAAAATSNFEQQGNIGAGTGATVGKWGGLPFLMKGGLGTAKLELGSLWVRALAVVNTVGDITDPQGNILAGAQRDGQFFARNNSSVRWQKPDVGFAENTLLSVIMTNARLDKTATYNLATRTQNGVGRVVVPAATSYDGDVIFSLSHGEVDANFDVLGQMAAEALQLAIINGVTAADAVPGIPAFGSRNG
jgi:L-aminopeptidase/D-esterase-like protein